MSRVPASYARRMELVNGMSRRIARGTVDAGAAAGDWASSVTDCRVSGAVRPTKVRTAKTRATGRSIGRIVPARTGSVKRPGAKEKRPAQRRPFVFFSGQSYRLPPLVSAMHAPPGRDHIVGVRPKRTWSLDAFFCAIARSKHYNVPGCQVLHHVPGLASSAVDPGSMATVSSQTRRSP